MRVQPLTPAQQAALATKSINWVVFSISFESSLYIADTIFLSVVYPGRISLILQVVSDSFN